MTSEEKTVRFTVLRLQGLSVKEALIKIILEQKDQDDRLRRLMIREVRRRGEKG